ncbi:DUF2155 domain-containing protein [Bosea sp. 117]|uniref:DUF2155 domain-containing protein n=1 Tax=Bosea sp. 117 TaxID=1125973 RepID=UPI00068B5AC1
MPAAYRFLTIPTALAALALCLGLSPAMAQQGWQGGVEAAPLPPAAVPDGMVQDPDSTPGGPGVPPIMEPPVGQPPVGQPPARQNAPAGQQGQPAPGSATAAPPEVPGQASVGPGGDIEVVQPPSQKVTNKTAVFSGLDKITGRIITFDVAINETVQFGALRITPRACYTRPATETQNTTGFIEVQELELDGEVKPLFGGWMFAASPGLHGVEHPIYDVWLIDCKQSAPVIASPGGQQ